MCLHLLQHSSNQFGGCIGNIKDTNTASIYELQSLSLSEPMSGVLVKSLHF